MTKTKRAAVLMEPGIMTLQERQIPAPAKNEALNRVKAAGICDSDV